MSYIPDEAVFAHYPDVKIDHDNIAHYRGLMAGRFLFGRCAECGTWVYPHRPLCPRCLSFDLVPTEASGRGRLHMYTLIMQSRDPDVPLAEPLQAAAIELEEGPRYLSQVVNCPVEALVHDMPVRLTWIEMQGRRWPAFEPAPETADG